MTADDDTITPRHDWTRDQVQQVLNRPFMDLLHHAHSIHRQVFNPNQIQVSTLLSIKTGACSEDCAYCPQSAHHNTELDKAPLMALAPIMTAARNAKANGATRFCMGAAWRQPNARDFPKIIEIVKAVRDLGMETCMTLGMLTPAQSAELADAGLDYYNHNLDTSPEFYERIITTRSYQERLDTLANVRDAGIHVCSGGILGMGEDQADRAGLLHQLATLPRHPESVPINNLVRVAGTPLAEGADLDPIEFVRVIAAARILMPRSVVRLSAGRAAMTGEMQALCFFAGANSVFYGDKLLTTPNPDENADLALFAKLGMNTAKPESPNPNPTLQ